MQDDDLPLVPFTHKFRGPSTILWSGGPARLREKLKLLYLHYQNIYGHKTMQDGDLP